jgi:hypothetical protein
MTETPKRRSFDRERKKKVFKKKVFGFLGRKFQIQLIPFDVMDSQSHQANTYPSLFYSIYSQFSLSFLSSCHQWPTRPKKKKKLPTTTTPFLFSLAVVCVCVCRGGDVQCMCCVSHWVAERAQPDPKNKKNI